MANDGFVKIHRKLLDNPIVCKDADYLAVWCYLLLTATHKGYDKEFKGKRITLQPGQLITGRKSIAKKFKIDESKVQRILKKFESEHQIEQQSSNRNRLITILNWGEYQKREQQEEHQMNNKRTTDEQQVNNRCTTDEHIQECKECKNDEEGKNDKNTSLSKQSSDKVKEVIEYLNQKTGKSFKPASKGNQRHINARFNEDFTVEDFKKVIDIKCSQWLNDDYWKKFLRPETLFGGKFESYLQEWVEPKKEFEYKTAMDYEFDVDVENIDF